MGQVVSIDELRGALAPVRAAGRSIVLTNGCFDLLHVGHVRLLGEARRLGDVVVVGVNSDASVRRLKGAGRPLVPEDERAEVLAALECVDYVVIFDEPTAETLARIVRPDIYVKGGDYAAGPGAERVDEARLPEARIVRAGGGRTVLVPLAAGRSTTALVEQIRSGSTPA